MTELAFHFNAPDRLYYTCRLLRKAVQGGARLAVVGPAEVMHALDAALWTFSAVDFVPHCLASADPIMVQASPVVLVSHGEDLVPREVLVNLGQEVASGFEQFERVIEVVGLQDDDRRQARARWRHYAQRGYAIQQHDLAKFGA